MEALKAKQEIPKEVRKRGRLILMAADGAANREISKKLKLTRQRVIYWRRRFAAEGIRGLWDRDGVLPRARIPEQVEKAIVNDCLYVPRSSLWLPWDV